MSNLLHLEVITPVGMIYQGEVYSVVLPGSEGEFGVLKGHASLISSLKSGIIDIQKSDLEHEIIAIDSGYAKIDEDKTTVLVKGAVWVAGSNDSEIAKNLDKAKELIKSMSSDNIALAATFSKLDSSAKK